MRKNYLFFLFILCYIMVQTNIEYFNSNLKLFVLDIIKIYSDVEEDLREYYGVVLNSDICNEDKFIKRYMRKLGDKKDLISKKNDELFSEQIHILKGVDFKELMERETTTSTVKDSIWDYLQTLFVIGETIVSDSNSIKSLVENFKKIREADGDMSNLITEGTEPSEEDTQVLEMLKNLSEKTQESAEGGGEINEELINNGLIGNLAKELAEDINLDEFNLNIDENSENVNDVFSNLISGDNPMKFMNLIQNVGQKIQSKLSDGNIDQSKLVDEAQQMMGMLGNNNPLFENLMGKARGNAQSENSSHNNPTKDRLRRKLEQRKKAKK
jgi:hypothetical protein